MSFWVSFLENVFPVKVDVKVSQHVNIFISERLLGMMLFLLLDISHDPA